MKSVLIVNLKSLPTWHLDLAQGFRANDVAAEVFLTQPQTLAERFDKSLRGRKWSDSALTLHRLVAHAKRLRPDMILFLGLLGLPASAVAALEQGLNYRPLLCSWICDCFREPQFAHWVAADHAFYFDSFLADVLPRFYPDSSCYSFLPLAAAPQRYHPLGVPPHADALAFVGNVSANRAALIDAISARVPVSVHGPNSGHRRFNRRRKLDSAAINRIYNQHRLVLNINQAPNTEHGANLRTFEVPAAGACLLTQATRDLPMHYEPDHEVLAWDSPEMLMALYERGISEPARLNTIAAAGRSRTLSDHTFKVRAASMLRTLS